MLKKGEGVKNIVLYDHALKDVKYNLITGFLSCYLVINYALQYLNQRIRFTILGYHWRIILVHVENECGNYKIIKRISNYRKKC